MDIYERDFYVRYLHYQIIVRWIFREWIFIIWFFFKMNLRMKDFFGTRGFSVRRIFIKFILLRKIFVSEIETSVKWIFNTLIIWIFMRRIFKIGIFICWILIRSLHRWISRAWIFIRWNFTGPYSAKQLMHVSYQHFTAMFE